MSTELNIKNTKVMVGGKKWWAGR